MKFGNTDVWHAGDHQQRALQRQLRDGRRLRITLWRISDRGEDNTGLGKGSRLKCQLAAGRMADSNNRAAGTQLLPYILDDVDGSENIGKTASPFAG